MANDYIIPLQKVANQSVACNLAGQVCVIDIRKLGGDLFLSLTKDGESICKNVKLVSRSPIVCAPYTGFIGDMIVIDTREDENPRYEEWGSRFYLLYNQDGYE